MGDCLERGGLDSLQICGGGEGRGRGRLGKKEGRFEGGGVDTLMHTVLPLFIFTNYTYQKGRLGEGNLIFLVRTVGRIILSRSVG